MNHQSVVAHQRNIADEQEHLAWTVDHMRALAVVRKIEARIYLAEVEIHEHRSEIMRHEIALQQGNLDAATVNAHTDMRQDHLRARARHRQLVDAVHALEMHL